MLTAFKSGEDVYSLSMIFEPTLDNFKNVFSSQYEFGAYYLNSSIVVLVALLITLPVSILAAYSLSRFNIFGKQLLLFLILSTQFIPLIVNVIPFFTLLKSGAYLIH